MSGYSTSTGASLERALRHWRERGALLELSPAGRPHKAMTIAISRESGAGGATVAAALSSQLGWPLYDRQLVDQIAEDTGIQSQLLGHLDEYRPNWFEECWQGFSLEKNISGVGFAIRMKRILLALYLHGDCIVLGRGAAQILPADRALRVRLVAPQEYRAHRFAKQSGASEQDANRQIIELDHQRDDFVKSYFHKDPTDPHEYDLVINTASFSEPACVELILSALKGRNP